MTGTSNHKSTDTNAKRYRSRNDIIAELLKIALDGTTKTKLMYNGYLSYRMVQDYLSILLGNGLLEFDAKDQKYHTTKKGNDFLKMYEQTKI